MTFHHHEVVGARMARKRLKALRYPNDLIEDVAQLVFLHLRFYGYRSSEWTDSAVRRYVVDAGPLLPRLHKLVRSDCTTRNKRKAAALSAAYDALEERIAALRGAGGAGRDPPRPGRQRDHAAPRHPARPARSARPTSTCWRCGWSTARSATSGRSRSCRQWWAERAELGRTARVAPVQQRRSATYADGDDDAPRPAQCPSSGSASGGEHRGGDERDVDERVVQREHPAAERVGDAAAGRACRR